MSKTARQPAVKRAKQLYDVVASTRAGVECFVVCRGLTLREAIACTHGFDAHGNRNLKAVIHAIPTHTVHQR